MQKILPGLEKLELINHIEEFLHSKDFDAKTAEIYENIWHYTKNSYFPKILMQKLKKFTQKYDSILRILTSQGFWCKNSRNSCGP